MIIRLTVYYLRATAAARNRLDQATKTPDSGLTTVEYVIWIGIAAVAAIAIGAIVTALYKSKAHSLKLN